MYTNLNRMYSALVQQYGRYLGHVAQNIGGRYVTNKSVEEAGPKYAPVPKDHQKKCLDFLNRRVFQKPSWLVDQPYMFNLTDTPEEKLYPLVNNVVSTGFLLSVERLDRLASFAQAGTGNYTPEEYLEDLHSMVFSELEKGGKVSSYRRYLQNRFVSTALEAVKAPRSKTSPSRALLVGELMDIQKKAAKGKGSDAATRGHWLSIAQQIEQGLK